MNPQVDQTSVRNPASSVTHLERPLYGLMAEFTEHDQLLDAARRAYTEGYRRMDAFSPFPIDELAEAIGHEYSLVPLITLVGGMMGGLGGYFMQWYAMARLYPINVGGRPHNSWPNFIPITFELTILVASASAFISMLILNRLPQPHHPVFNVPQFRRASIDRFFLCIEVEDPKFEREGTERFLAGLKPTSIVEVEDD
jgi:hypothetical protein